MHCTQYCPSLCIALPIVTLGLHGCDFGYVVILLPHKATRYEIHLMPNTTQRWPTAWGRVLSLRAKMRTGTNTLLWCLGNVFNNLSVVIYPKHKDFSGPVMSQQATGDWRVAVLCVVWLRYAFALRRLFYLCVWLGTLFCKGASGIVLVWGPKTPRKDRAPVPDSKTRHVR